MSLGRYRLQVQLGAGPDGIAYRALAENRETVELVDLTPLKSDVHRWPQTAHRLRLAARVEHPAVTRVKDLDLGGDAPFVALEWVEGQCLADAVRDALPLSEQEALAIICAIAQGLAEAHRIGVAHGRVNPRSIVLGAERCPKLDLTGLSVRTRDNAESGEAGAETGSAKGVGGTVTLTERAEDVRGLGELIVWMLEGQTLGDRAISPGATAACSPELAQLADKMRAVDPLERPLAREVVTCLDEIANLSGKQSQAGGTEATTMELAASAGLGTIAAPSLPSFMGGHSASPRLGRFRLVEEVGQGAQGMVYRAEDTADGSIVALKVLRAEWVSRPEVLQRFRKEARMLAEVNGPHVVNLLEQNEDGGMPYLVLEFVEGRNVQQLLAGEKQLDEPMALSIMADVARALAPAHERGIVHRDIKPANILLVEPLESSTGTDGRPRERRVKLSDFGLARHVVDTQSLAMTEPGAILGTPHYMAPEQITARAVDPRTDVYAMGATLFHMLAGRPPFTASSRDVIFRMHCHEPPPPLERFNTEASPGVGQLIARCLMKAPEERYPDASALLRDLERLLRGEPTGMPAHPLLPKHESGRMLRFELTWDLESTPSELWPHVTNTDRLDRAIGFAPVTYTTLHDPKRGLRRFAEGRKAGRVEKGEEFPYEWVEPRRMGILRDYSQGPFRWLVSEVELQPGSAGGTRLVHRLRLEPRDWLVRVGSNRGIGNNLREALGRVYRRIDAATSGKRGRTALVDPFEEVRLLSPDRRRLLDRGLEGLVVAGVDPAVAEALGDYLESGADPEVARIRPLALAARLGLDPDEVVKACLHGANEGLLVLMWDLLCPVCRISSEIQDTLRAIRDHGHCEACNLDFELDFAGSVELIFRAHPQIREADTRTYCIGGPAHSPHVPAQVRLAAGEVFELELALGEGPYRLRGPQLPWSVDFHVVKGAAARRWDIDLARGPERGMPLELAPGAQDFLLRNDSTQELVVRVERAIPRTHVLSAAKASTLALFRELFPSERLAPGQLVSIATLTFLATDLDLPMSLYESLGDARAFALIHEHFQILGDAVREGRGAIVKTIGEGVLAAFSEPVGAVRVGLELQDRLRGGKNTRDLRVRVGLHHGPAMATTLDDRLDYFGATVDQTLRLAHAARGGDVVISRSLAGNVSVAEVLRSCHGSNEVIEIGVAGQPVAVRVSRVS